MINSLTWSMLWIFGESPPCTHRISLSIRAAKLHFNAHSEDGFMILQQADDATAANRQFGEIKKQ